MGKGELGKVYKDGEIMSRRIRMLDSELSRLMNFFGKPPEK